MRYATERLPRLRRGQSKKHARLQGCCRDEIGDTHHDEGRHDVQPSAEAEQSKCVRHHLSHWVTAGSPRPTEASAASARVALPNTRPRAAASVGSRVGTRERRMMAVGERRG